MNQKQGWINTQTGEVGAFDSKGDMRKYSVFEKIKNWWNAPNFNSEEYWKFDSVITVSVSFFGNVNKYDDSVYINDVLKKCKTARGNVLDYNAWTTGKSVVFMK